MSLPETLRRARALLAGGWAEPLPRDGEGRICAAGAEGVVTFDVLSAVELCGGPGELADALELLGAAALPAATVFARALERACLSGEPAYAVHALEAAQAAGAAAQLSMWLEHPSRKLEHVLRLFDLAILRAQSIQRAANR